MNIYDDHHFSGWPGAYCMKCGAADPREQSLADGLWDCDEEQQTFIWKGTDEQWAAEKAAMICPVKGILVWEDEVWVLKEPTSALSASTGMQQSIAEET